MKTLLLAGLAGATAIATVTPVRAHPTYHYTGGCKFLTLSNGDASTEWTGDIYVDAVATEAGSTMPAATASISVVCELRINGSGTIVFEVSGTGVAVGTDKVSFNAGSGDVVTLCDNVTVNGEFHKNCGDGMPAPVVPQPIQDLVDQLRPVECDDGSDNDGDGQADSSDPGCAHPVDPDERGTTACDDGIDNDGDGKADFPEDPDCTGPDDPDERDAAGDVVGCDDGLDNDADGQVDSADPGCADRGDANERGDTACDDDVDNDGDLRSDYPADPGCTGPADTDEAGPGACVDGIDNDGDLAADTSDPGCSGPSDTDERGTGACDDGVDNDGDGKADYPHDTGCDGPGDSSERSAMYPCDDGTDNDGDGVSDYPADPGCRTATDPNETTIP